MRESQRAGALGIRQKTPRDRETATLHLRQGDDAGAAANRRIRELLGLDAATSVYEVIFATLGPDADSDRHLSINSRSTLQVMAEFASFTDVPAADIDEGRVDLVPRSAGQQRLFAPLLHVASGDTPPKDAYAAVRYRGRWFWIDDRDLRS